MTIRQTILKAIREYGPLDSHELQRMFPHLTLSQIQRSLHNCTFNGFLVAHERTYGGIKGCYPAKFGLPGQSKPSKFELDSVWSGFVPKGAFQHSNEQKRSGFDLVRTA